MKVRSIGFDYEKPLWDKGLLVGGCDEVGRGSFAGPVVAAVVVFPPGTSFELQSDLARHNIIIDDSKKLSARSRERTSLWIKKTAVAVGLGKVGVPHINRYGIKKATETAMRRAVSDCRMAISHLLVDAFYVPHLRGLGIRSQTAIVKGDSISLSIAAASIVAKVYRDALMQSLSANEKYFPYGWDTNKGYGTEVHREAIIKYGLTRHHRNQFVNTFLRKANNRSM